MFLVHIITITDTRTRMNSAIVVIVRQSNIMENALLLYYQICSWVSVRVHAPQHSNSQSYYILCNSNTTVILCCMLHIKCPMMCIITCTFHISHNQSTSRTLHSTSKRPYHAHTTPHPTSPSHHTTIPYHLTQPILLSLLAAAFPLALVVNPCKFPLLANALINSIQKGR